MRTPILTNALAWISRLSPLVHVLRVRARTRARGWYNAHTGARLISFTHFASVTNTPPHLWAGLCFLTSIFLSVFLSHLYFLLLLGTRIRAMHLFHYIRTNIRTNIQEFSITLFTHAAITVLLPTKLLPPKSKRTLAMCFLKSQKHWTLTYKSIEKSQWWIFCSPAVEVALMRLSFEVFSPKNATKAWYAESCTEKLIARTTSHPK
jgi:uncharacterized membrane protein YecN with MAPEG domain